MDYSGMSDYDLYKEIVGHDSGRSQAAWAEVGRRRSVTTDYRGMSDGALTKWREVWTERELWPHVEAVDREIERRKQERPNSRPHPAAEAMEAVFRRKAWMVMFGDVVRGIKASIMPAIHTVIMLVVIGAPCLIVWYYASGLSYEVDWDKTMTAPGLTSALLFFGYVACAGDTGQFLHAAAPRGIVNGIKRWRKSAVERAKERA